MQFQLVAVHSEQRQPPAVQGQTRRKTRRFEDRGIQTWSRIDDFDDAPIVVNVDVHPILVPVGM
jgi:hypothetical protein